MVVRRRRTNGGFTFVEVLVAIAVLGILVGGLATATMTNTTAAASINRRERIDVLLTSFAELVKALDYQRCPDPAGSTYGELVAANLEIMSEADAALVRDGDVKLEVTSISYDGSCAGDEGDGGTQEVAIRVEYGAEFSRTATVTKRDPDALLQAPKIQFRNEPASSGVSRN